MISIASSGVSGGSTPGNALAIIVLPLPGGPNINRTGSTAKRGFGSPCVVGEPVLRKPVRLPIARHRSSNSGMRQALRGQRSIR